MRLAVFEHARVANPFDRRSSLIELTAAGRRLLVKASKVLRSYRAEPVVGTGMLGSNVTST